MDRRVGNTLPTMYASSPQRGGNDPLAFLKKSYVPVTLTLVIVNVVAWFCAAALGSANPFRWLAFDTLSWPLPHIWSVVTWPLNGAGHPLSLLFGCLWFYQFGGSLERSWGSRSYAGFLAAVCALTAVSVWVGAHLIGGVSVLSGLWLAAAAPTVAWTVLNRRETVNLYFFPIPAPALAALACAVLWYEVGPPFLGLFALAGCAAAYWYAAKGRYAFGVTRRFENERRPGSAHPPIGRDGTPTQNGAQKGFNLLRWWKDRQERKRLEDIFRRSGFTDDERR